MRRLILILIFTSLLATLLSVTAFANEIRIEALFPEDAVKSGENFSIGVNLVENPGFYAVQLSLSYDRNAMDCTEVRIGDLLQESFNGVNPSRGTGAFMMAASINEVADTGEIVSFQFIAKQDMEEIQCELQDVIFTDLSGEKMPYSISSGQ